MAANAQDIFDDLETPIGGVPSAHIMQVWDRVEPLLSRCVRDNSGYSIMDLLTELQFGRMQLWIIGDFQGAIVTQIKTPPTGAVLWVQYMAGDHMNEWLDDWIAAQEAFARDQGCVAIEFAGRKGWNRIERQHPEYKATWTIFRRELDG